MSDQGIIRMPLAILTAGLAMYAFVPGCQASGSNGQMSPEQQQRFESMQAEGVQVSLTVFPIVMGNNAALNQDVANVLALLLEKAGLTNLETSDAAFAPPNDASYDQAAKLFGNFISENPIETDYALYAEFIGTPAKGPTEIRGVIVDKTGQSVWLDRQTTADRDFKRAKPDGPMTCCVFLAERVRKQLGIPTSARDDSGQGKIARMFAENSPGPGKAERAAMEQRQSAMKKAGSGATMVVFPVRFSDDEAGAKDATHLAEMLNGKKLCKAKSLDSPLRVKVRPGHNEQKRLWQLARTFQDHIKQNPPDADYAILADYMMHPKQERAWAVHFVVCDRKGQWVIVDFQNDHHGDFQSIDPKTHDACALLVAKRLEGYLR